MQPTLVIFSGLPGTGKSALANRLARELRWPILRIDDVAGEIPAKADFRFWDEKILVLLTIAEAQLALGVCVIADSVFMGADRLHAQEIAKKHNALFRPVYCFVSDQALWEKRVTERFDMLGNPSSPPGSGSSTSASGLRPGKRAQAYSSMRSTPLNRTTPECWSLSPTRRWRSNLCRSMFRWSKDITTSKKAKRF